MPRLEAELAESIGVAISCCVWGLACLKFDHTRKHVLSLTEIADDIYGRTEKLHSLLSFSPLTKASQLLNCTHRPLLPTGQPLHASQRPFLGEVEELLQVESHTTPDCEYASMGIPCEMILMGKFLFQVGQQGFACGQILLKGFLLSSVRHHTWLVISCTKAQVRYLTSQNAFRCS
ncbi:putative DNA-binding protein [Trichinella spiralis]|uniref:Uncharacterized protein n=1 Tax=Trichinella spiralis TaxID=6334 RepID=E5RZ06_TRISP|nr:putative DNA-binding protein [Trichinella spiralis]KRY32107.1 hypothetical protein T01_5023 [Trichinella spiralis]